MDTRTRMTEEDRRRLMDVDAALAALPRPRLIRGVLSDGHGGVCAMGAYCRAFHAPAFCHPPVTEENDRLLVDETPDMRYTRMRAWLQAQIAADV